MKVPGFTDIQRAARYLVLIKFSFGKMQNSYATAEGANFANTVEYLAKVQERLQRVNIENRDFPRKPER